jgi:hypothetical protein
MHQFSKTNNEYINLFKLETTDIGKLNKGYEACISIIIYEIVFILRLVNKNINSKTNLFFLLLCWKLDVSWYS